MNLRFLLIIPLCIILTGCGSRYEELPLGEVSASETEEPGSDVSKPAISEDTVREDTVAETTEPDMIYVYVCGQVMQPGVYQADGGARIYQLIEQAGGVTDKADIACINQAAVCGDGEMIYVPAVGESDVPAVYGASAKQGENTQAADDGLIDINTADTERLQKINGIGASRARDIVAYRENNGRFSCVEDIMKVPGIKEGMFSRIKDQIKV
jgi:competence protein ComEA